MDYKSLIAKGKKAHLGAKAKYPDERLSARLLVQFQNGTVYQYKCDSNGLTKFAGIDFNEVVLVQMASGTMSFGGRYPKFFPKVITMLECKNVYEAPSLNTVEADEEDPF